MTNNVDAPRFYLDQVMENGEIHQLAAGTAGVFSRRCPEKQTPNEDAALLIPVGDTSGVLAVADGFGSGWPDVVDAGSQCGFSIIQFLAQ